MSIYGILVNPFHRTMGYNVLRGLALMALILGMIGLVSCETTQSVGETLPDSALQTGQVLGTIYFSAESSVLSEQALLAIQEIAQRVLSATTEGATVALAVQGHTALAGTAGGRSRLSLRRAEMVAQQLQAGGIAVNAIQLDSFGAEQPAANNDTAEGRELNRRTVVLVHSLAQSNQ